MNWGGLSGCGFTYNKKKKYYKAKKIVIETPIQGKNNKELRSCSKYKYWRDFCLIRDNNCCVKCNSKIRVEVHHIVPWASYKKERFSLDNGQTLCHACHSEIHPWLQSKKENISSTKKVIVRKANTLNCRGNL